MQAVVTDSFNIKGRAALEYGVAGVVVCFAIAPSDEAPEQGKDVVVIRSDGWLVRTRWGEVRGSDGSYSAFIASLTKAEVPIGSHLRWGAAFWPAAEEAPAINPSARPLTASA